MDSMSKKKTTQTQLFKKNLQLKIKSDKRSTRESSLESMIKNGVQNETKSSPGTNNRSDFIKLYDETITKIAKSNEKNSVYVIKAEILSITEQNYTFEEKPIVYFLIRIKGGQVTTSSKKANQRFNFNEVNVRSSLNAMVKYELKVGDIITFKGKLKSDNFSGDVIKNIRTFTKH